MLAADAPDLPGLLIGKLLRPLTTRPVPVAPASTGRAARGRPRAARPGLASRPRPGRAGPADLRDAAPRPADVAVTPGWHRLRGPADLARLDPALEGWDTTRALLSV